MARYESCLVYLAILSCILQIVRSEEAEHLRNIPAQLTPTGKSAGGSQVQPRFLPPFSASFSLSAGGNNAQSFSVSGGPDGIGLSQSSSHGNPGLSTSQSSSLAAGLNGISASDSSSIAANHPLFGQQAHATGNAISLGQAAASSQGNVVNGQATSGAQSSVGSTHSQASSGAQSSLTQGQVYPGFQPSGRPVHPESQNLVLRPDRPSRPYWSNAQPSYANGHPGDYYYNGKPSLTISVDDRPTQYGSRPSGGWYAAPDRYNPYEQENPCSYSWYRDPRCRGPRVTVSRPGYRPSYSRPYYENYERDPRDSSATAAQVSAASSAQSGPGGLSIGQSSSQANSGSNGPSSLTINKVETSGNAEAQAQGIAGGVQQGRPGSIQANLSSGSVTASSKPGGSAQGSSVSSTSAGNSNSQVNSSSKGPASANGSANAGAAIAFPGPSGHSSAHSNIPQEFVRSSKTPRKAKKQKDPLDKFITDLSDTVYDLLDY